MPCILYNALGSFNPNHSCMHSKATVHWGFTKHPFPHPTHSCLGAKGALHQQEDFKLQTVATAGLQSSQDFREVINVLGKTCACYNRNVSLVLCSSWPWCHTTNISNSGLAFKWRWWSTSLSDIPSLLPLQHGFHISASPKWSEVFIPTPQDTLLCAVWSQHSIPEHPLSPLLNPSKQPFHLLTCYEASEDFCLLVEDVDGDVSGRLEVQRVALEQDQGCEMGMAAWVRHLGLCPALTPWLGCTDPAVTPPVQGKPRVGSTALCGPGSALL